MFAIIPSNPAVGDMSSKVWPHISVVPWIQLGESRHEALAEISDIVHATAPVALRPGGMMTVGGEGHEKAAQRIVSEQLTGLHKRLLQCLGGFGIVVSHPEWAGNNYRPHITTERRAPTVQMTVNKMYVIDNLRLKSEDDRGTKVITQSLQIGSYEI